MNRLWIGSIGLALGTVAVSYALHREALSETQALRSNIGSITAEIRGTENTASDDRRLAAPGSGQTAGEPLPAWDTTGLLQETMTVGELLEEIDADAGEDFRPVDRERLAALLRSDPELQRAVRE